MKQVFLAIRATVYATAFVALWAWLAVSVQPLDAKLGLILPRWVQPPGFVIATCGAILALSCIVLFVRAGRGTPAPFDPPREFVASGPYRYVRNPMYIGGLSVILGAGLMLRSASIACLALIFTVVIHLFVVFYEEPALERRFGSSYRSYTHSVRRWLPTRSNAASAGGGGGVA